MFFSCSCNVDNRGGYTGLVVLPELLPLSRLHFTTAEDPSPLMIAEQTGTSKDNGRYIVGGLSCIQGETWRFVPHLAGRKWT